MMTCEAALNNFQHLEGLRVLLVDDDFDSLELTAIILEQYGVQVMTADSANAALEVLTHYEPEILISDIGMPLVDGYSLMRKVRTLPSESLKLVPAIALTAFATEDECRKALEAGFQMHVSKPIAPDDLVTIVAQLADHR